MTHSRISRIAIAVFFSIASFVSAEDAAVVDLGKTRVVAPALAGETEDAGMGFYRNRDSQKFEALKARPFKSDKDVVVVIMREGIPRGGGYTYQYPRENPEPVMTDKYYKEGGLSMEIELVATDYSGVAVCIAGSADLTPYLEEGVLEFWIKGEKGGENALFVLVDDGVKSNGESLQVKLRSKSFGEITTEWKKFIIPLKLFGKMGVYWDEKNWREVTMPFNWANMKGFRLEVRKDENTSFKVWIDDVVIKRKGPEYQGPSGYPFRNEI
ncbi:MAG TPA: carbohydrate binding domain-containing protein [Fibrobacteraceae bacterium]|nr:carbohydrate binding domain-containing protein [Fibrobacteraceae bacterium]